MQEAAIVVLGAGGLAVARKVAVALGGAELHGLRRRIHGVDVPIDDLGAHLRALYAAGRPIVGICAAGILVRLLAPALGGKTEEPPVIAVAEDGSAVVPLLGGHRGANRTACAIARRLGTVAATTTAGDVRFGIALDDPPPGWTLANPEHVKAFVTALLGGTGVRVAGDMPWLAAADLPRAVDGPLEIVVSDARIAGGETRLVYHPKTLAVGVGCERGVAADEVMALVERCLDEAGLAPASVAGLYSLDLKMDEPAIHAAAAALGVPVRFFTAVELEAERPRLATPSEEVYRAVGCHGVAEGAALAAVGPKGALVLPKQRGARVTCAVARATEPFDGAARGRARGLLAVVGLGPGAREWRTPEAEHLLAAADEVVGYRFYLDQLGRAIAGKRFHAFELGEEEARVRRAFERAAAGRRVALVSSGDAGIYAMGALVFEVLEGAEDDAWRRVEIVLAPGVSAMQAAAARIGAPLGHDFCTISLSDLLTPWERIERRLRAAGEGDFVVALYNPVSRRRREGLVRARDILLAYRSPDTPVVLASRLGSGDETVTVVPLAELVPDLADMRTLILVGSSETRIVSRPGAGIWVYTPRGYRTGRRAGGISEAVS